MRQEIYIIIGFIISGILSVLSVSYILINNNLPLTGFFDTIGLIFVFVPSLLLFYMTFNTQYGAKDSDQEMYLYKVTWLREILIIFGAIGLFLGIYLLFLNTSSQTLSEADFLPQLSLQFAIALMTMLYALPAAFSLKFTYSLTMNKFNKSSIMKEDVNNRFINPINLIFLLILLIMMNLVVYLASSNAGSPIIIPMIIYQIFDNHNLLLFIILLVFAFSMSNFSMKSFFYNILGQKEEEEEVIINQINSIITIKKLIYAILLMYTFFIPFGVLLSIMNNVYAYDNSSVQILISNLEIPMALTVHFLLIIAIIYVIQGKYNQKLYHKTRRFGTYDNSFIYFILLTLLWFIIMSIIYLAFFIIL